MQGPNSQEIASIRAEYLKDSELQELEQRFMEDISRHRRLADFDFAEIERKIKLIQQRIAEDQKTEALKFPSFQHMLEKRLEKRLALRSRTHCAECDCEIPPGKAGRLCKGCRNV